MAQSVETHINKPGDREEKNSTRQTVRSAGFWILIAVLAILWLVGWGIRVYLPWVHLLGVAALLVAVFELLTRVGHINIEANSTEIPKWDPAKPAESLTDIHKYVIDEAAKSTAWYWRAKQKKARPSQVIRFLAWILAAVGGLLPVLGTLFQDHLPIGLNLGNGLWASLVLGIAAALFGLDKAFGYSSGWARYVLTATNIRKALEDFRMDWAALMAKAGNNLTADSVAPLIERAKQFRSDVESLVLQETKDWVTEFQSSMAQMEKDVAAQIATLKMQVDKTIQAKEAASQPGSIQMTIKDPNKNLTAGSVKVTVIDSNNKTVLAQQSIELTWTSPFIPPGLYQVKIEATVGNAPFSQAAQVTVKPGESASAEIAIP